jgi:hypothetical protein
MNLFLGNLLLVCGDMDLGYPGIEGEDDLREKAVSPARKTIAGDSNVLTLAPLMVIL